MTTEDCKKLIEQKCVVEWERIRNEFDPPLTSEDVKKTTAKNWRRVGKETNEDIVTRAFDCRPFDDQLRAYVEWESKSDQTRVSIETE